MIEQLTNKVGDTMNNFFDKFEKDQKLNLFIGDFLSKITGYPTRLEMAESILSDIKQSAKGYIRNIDSFAETSQTYLDAVVSSKKGLIKHIREIFDLKHHRNVEIYRDIFNSGYFESIFTMNYDVVIERMFASLLSVSTPLKAEKITEGKIRFYKIMGTIYNSEDLFLTSQDIRKLKVLEFYKEFFDNLRFELISRPTIFLGVDLKNPDFLNMLDFLLSMAKNNEHPVYLVTSTAIIDPKVTDLINKYNIKLTTLSEKELLANLHSVSDIDGDDVLRKKLVR